jgi:hypothetical protein
MDFIYDMINDAKNYDNVIYFVWIAILMSLLSRRIFERLKQRILFVVDKSSNNEALRSSLAITFAVAMATFFVCDVHAIKASKTK